jgi:Zn-finger nucleic acid-binding protein
MKCPSCPDTTLAMTERQGVEIDYCPQCRGVWLDRGELDKLIERAATVQPAAPAAAQPQQRRPDFVDSDYGHHKKRHKSWLSDIFD